MAMKYTLLVILIGLGLFILVNIYQIVVIEVQVIHQEKEHQELVEATHAAGSSSSSSSAAGNGGKQRSKAKAGAGNQHGPPINRADFQGAKLAQPPGSSNDGAAAATKSDGPPPPNNHHNRIPPPQHDGHAVAGLSCGNYGGPSDEVAAEMVYWRDIPGDARHVSPFRSLALNGGEKYLTFEPDEGGWNNIRMGMETTVMLALSMGRTLVLPPEQNLYLLNQKGDHGKHKTVFGFGDFFHFRSIQAEHGNGAGAVRVLTFEEFLNETLGTLRTATDNYQSVVYPPDNRTHWDVVMGHNFHSSKKGGGQVLWPWMRRHMTDTKWNSDECIAYFPASPGNNGEAGWKAFTEVEQEFKAKFKKTVWARVQSYTGHPTPVDAPLKDRMAEMMVDRNRLCVYNTALQQRQVVHFKGEQSTGQRMLIHFYAFLFYEDWRHDLWTKRFVRDHLRYIDEIQCAAARVVRAVREVSRARGDPAGSYDSMHIRRGDFQYKEMHMDAEFIYSNNTATWMKDGRTVFMATDEKKKDYFEPLKKHYHVVFLDDFKEALGDVNSNFYGMIDQLVASRGDTFTGAYYSTFTGFINRVRGYHAQNQRGEGWDQGAIKSYYYTPFKLAVKRRIMHKYKSIGDGFWPQEFHVSWRDIDHDLDQAQPASTS